MNRYIAVFVGWLTVYVGSGFIPSIDNSYYFVVNAALSAMLVFYFLNIVENQTTVILSILETIAVFVSLFACIGYMTRIDLIYTYYEAILRAINLAELIVLIGVPFHGNRNRYTELWRTGIYSNAGFSLHSSAYPTLKKQEK